MIGLNHMRNVLLSLSLFVSFMMVGASLPALALDCDNPLNAKEAAQCGACETAGQSNCDTSAPETTLSDTIAQIINILSAIVGAVAVIMIIIGGFRYITSGGSADKIKSARDTLLYAIVGLIIVALAQIIVHFVINRVNAPATPSTPPSGTPINPNPRGGGGI